MTQKERRFSRSPVHKKQRNSHEADHEADADNAVSPPDPDEAPSEPSNDKNTGAPICQDVGSPQAGLPSMEFDAWMDRHRSIVENRPDDYYFGVVRRYPKIGQNGEQLAGTVRRLTVPFTERWLCDAHPEGGRFSIELRGPTKDGGAKYPGLKQTVAVYHNLEIPMRGMMREEELPPPEDAVEKEEELVEGAPAANNPFIDRIVDRYIDEGEQARTRLRELQESFIMQNAQPSPAPAPSDNNSPVNQAFVTLVEAIAAKPESSGDSKEEVLRLHGLVNKLQEANSTEKIATMAGHRDEMEKRLSEQRATYESMVKASTDAAADTKATLIKQYDDAIVRLKEGHVERADQLKERHTEAKEELTETRANLRKTSDDLATARTEAMMAQSELAALKVTKAAELSSALSIAKLEAIQEAQKQSDSRKSKDPDEGPFEGLIKQIRQAKELSTSLGEHLGLSKSPDGSSVSRIEQLADIAVKIGGSKEIRGLAGTVTKAAAEGVGMIIKSRQEAQQASQPSTSALTAAWRNGQRTASAQQQPATQRQISPQEPAASLEAAGYTESIGAHPDEAPVPDVIDSVSELLPDVEKLRQAAEAMFDIVENHAAVGTPIAEATEDLVSRVQVLLQVSPAEVIEGMAGATAESTLEDLNFPPSRLSPGATAYMNELIKHAQG